MGNRNRIGISAALVTLAAAVLLAQPQAPPTFRSAIEAVQIDVYVTDATGNPVKGLTVDDFALIENGKPNPITTFEAVDIPIERAESIERTLAEPDVLTNETPLGRVYLFALDEVHNTEFMPNVLRTRRFVRQFIEEHFGPNDVGAIALLGRGLATDGQDFTSNRRLLLNAIDRFSGGFPDGPRNGMGRDCTNDRRLPSGASDGRNRLDGSGGGSAASSRSQQMASLRSLAELMARIPGRHKAMILFTECLDIDVLDIVDYNGGVLTLRGEDAHAAMAAATRSNIAIYPIDPTGLSLDAAPLETIGAFRSLGEATGGFALINSNSFTQTFERIVRDSSTYYMLAFNSTYDRDDGKYVRVDVRVKRPGLTVRSREGYTTPTRLMRLEQERARARAPTSAVATALTSPLAARGIPMRVFATAFKGRGRNAAVAMAVEMDAAALGLQEKNGVVSGKVDIRYLATDAQRNVYPEVARTVAVELKPAGRARVPLEQVRVRVVSELELPAGRYQLRVAVGAAIVAGNVVYDLEIPDFSDGPLAMSGLALVARSEPLVLTLGSAGGSGGGKAAKCYTELCGPPPTSGPASSPTVITGNTWLQGRLPGPPTTVREFAGSDEVLLATEIYDNTKPARKDAPARTLTLSAELRAADGRVVPVASETRPATTRSATGGHLFTARLPLRGVPPGQYALRVQARSSANEDQVVSREIAIRVK